MINQLRSKMISKYIIITCVLVFLIAMPAIWVPSYQLLAEVEHNWAETIRYTLTALLTIGMIFLFWRKCLFTLKCPQLMKNLFSFGLLGVIGALGAFIFTYQPADRTPSLSIMIGCILMNLAVAVSEEFLFRGVILNGLIKAWSKQNKQNIVRNAVLVSCTIFGLRHLLNLITQPDAIFGTLAQVVFTFMAGTYLCALYLRTNNIWVCILIHFLEDFSTSVWQIFSTSAAASMNADVTISGAVMMVLLQIPYVIFAILMLRDKRWKMSIDCNI